MWWLLKSLGQLGPTRWYLMDGGMGGGRGDIREGEGGAHPSLARACTGQAPRAPLLSLSPLIPSSTSSSSSSSNLGLQGHFRHPSFVQQVKSSKGHNGHVTFRPQIVLYSPLLIKWRDHLLVESPTLIW